MGTLFVALGILLAGATLALLSGRRPALATVVGVGGAVIGGLLGLISALRAVALGTTATVERPWSVPGGSLAFQLDPLSAWFLIPIFAVTALAALYGGRYLQDDRVQRPGEAWFFFNLLTVSMAMLVLARNGVLFLVAWEVMSLASFFLVTYDDEDAQVRRAGRTYLIATHLGTAFLFGFFLLLGRQAGSLDFAAIAAAGPPPAGIAGALFVLAVIGFGTKAGFMPLHVWLPEAHPAAPSHVSAVMSGVMVKMGIYGLFRTLTLLPEVAAWWGWLLLGIGIISGAWGILHALAQSDLKRLLAYSTVENVGIIALGMGLGVLGVAAQVPAVAVLGFAGALLHVLNHSLIKGLLFLGAGAIVHATGTRQIDRLGGLARRMPLLTGAVIFGAVAIVGLPPLNGFVGEFLIYVAAFRSSATLPDFWAAPALLAIAALAIIGGLAAVTFSKVVGVALLGEPRSPEAEHAHRPAPLLVLPPLLLGLGCVLVVTCAPQVVGAVEPIAARVAGLPAPERHPMLAGELAAATAPVGMVLRACAIFLGILGLLAGLRAWLLRGRSVVTGSATWDCGYARPTPRMQYTGSSFVAPVLALFGEVIPVRKRLEPPHGLFPETAALETQVPDVSLEGLYAPIFDRFAGALRRLSWIQQGTTHVYILYIALTLIGLLVWYLGLGR